MAMARIPFAKIDPKGIPLAEVIDVHRRFTPEHYLPENLGDGFLAATNPVFRNMREAFLEAGFAFTREDRWNYFSFPLMCLDDVLAAGEIPYRPNVLWLEELEARRPATFTLTELGRSELQFNYLFHESAHFVAHHVLFGRQKIADVPKDSDSLLRILLGEAFANTTECVSAMFVEGEIGQYFLRANCHYRLEPKEAAVLVKAARKVSSLALVKALMAAFLYANFMYPRVGEKEKSQIWKAAGVKKGSALVPVIRNGFLLDDVFRTTTTHLHLVKQGFDPDLASLLRFDPVKRVSADSDLRAQFEALASILARDMDENLP